MPRIAVELEEFTISWDYEGMNFIIHIRTYHIAKKEVPHYMIIHIQIALSAVDIILCTYPVIVTHHSTLSDNMCF